MLRPVNAISRLIYRYAELVDQQRFDAVPDCFVPGAEFVLDGQRQDIVSLFAPPSDGLGRKTMHHITNIVIDLDGDEAVARCYVLVHRSEQCGQEMKRFLIGASYDDRICWTGEDWKFQHRTLKRDWIMKMDGRVLLP